MKGKLDTDYLKLVVDRLKPILKNPILKVLVSPSYLGALIPMGEPHVK